MSLMHFARVLVTGLGLGAFLGVGQLATPHPSPSSEAERCEAFCRVCDKCYASDAVAKATCNYLMNESEQGSDHQCEADCKAGVTPSAVARGGFGDNWQKLTCEQLTASL